MPIEEILSRLRKIAAYCEDVIAEEEIDELIEDIEDTQ